MNKLNGLAFQRVLTKKIPRPTIPEPVRRLFSDEVLTKVFGNNKREKAAFVDLASHAIAQIEFPKSSSGVTGVRELIENNFLELNQLNTDEERADWLDKHLDRVQHMAEQLDATRGRRKYRPEWPDLAENIPEKILNRIVRDLKFLTQDPYKNFDKFIRSSYTFASLGASSPPAPTEEKTKMDLTRIFIFETLIEHRKKSWDEAKVIAEWIKDTYGQSDKGLSVELNHMFFDFSSNRSKMKIFIPKELESKDTAKEN